MKWSRAPNQRHVPDLLVHVVNLSSSLTYFMVSHPLPLAGKWPINKTDARQRPTNVHTHTYAVTQLNKCIKITPFPLLHTHTHKYIHTYSSYDINWGA